MLEPDLTRPGLGLELRLLGAGSKVAEHPQPVPHRNGPRVRRV
ncbi:hypothetical protein ACFXJ8_26635 [Nonomuraea sp. NPDC059194]